MFTTLNKIRAFKPCEDGWKKLLKHLSKTKADDEQLSIITILDSNGLSDALWCLRAVDGYDREIRRYAVWCARQVQHLMTDPMSIAALDVAERYACGHTTEDDLRKARDAAGAARAAAWDAVRAAERAAARASAWAAAWAAGASAGASARAAWASAGTARASAGGAAGAAAEGAAWAAQEKKLREVCAEIEISSQMGESRFTMMAPADMQWQKGYEASRRLVQIQPAK